MSAALHYPFPDPPEIGAGVQLADGIQWLRLPVPGGLRHINVWLLEDDDGSTLVDTGMNVPQSRAAWQGPLAHYLQRRPLRRIICTHHHPDHAGLTAWLAACHDVPVYTSEPELALLQRLYAEQRDPTARAARLAGFARDGLEPTDELCRAMTVDGYLGVMSGLPTGVRILRAGDALEAGGRRWVVLMLAGHTDGQLLLYAPASGLLIAGDQVLPRISSNIGIYRERADPDPLDSYLASFATLEALAPEPLVLPSHGEVFYGLARRLAELRAHHQARLTAIGAMLGEPVPAAELAARLYRGTDPLNRVLALGETLAHLRYLEVRGELLVAEAPGGPRRYGACRSG